MEGVSDAELFWAFFSMAFMVVMPAFIGFLIWRSMKKDAGTASGVPESKG